MVRLIDIAERAGVSLETVSAVLSGRGNSIRFSKEKAEKIRAIAREMNYIPNFSAKMLSGQSSHTLGVLIDSGDVAVRYEQLAAIDQAAERRGYRLLIAEAHANAEKLLLNHRTLLQYGVDGVICTPTASMNRCGPKRMWYSTARNPSTASRRSIMISRRDIARLWRSSGRKDGNGLPW